MKKRITSIFCSFLLLPAFAIAQHHGSFEKNWFIEGTDTLPYRLLLPVNYDSQKEYPLILFLHGAGERGNNNSSQLNHGGNLFTRDSIMENYPAIVVFPQCAAQSRWSNMNVRRDTAERKTVFVFPEGTSPTTDMNLLINLIKDLKENYPVDNSRMYVGGLSLGGMGTYDLVYRMPKTFAAAFPICGAYNAASARKMKNTTWWIFHGQRDSTVSVEYGKEMAAVLRKSGAKVKLTIYPDASHNSWDQAFQEPGLFAWMFSKSIKQRHVKN